MSVLLGQGSSINKTEAIDLVFRMIIVLLVSFLRMCQSVCGSKRFVGPTMLGNRNPEFHLS